ncbi:hypothetical protein CU098_011498 [Rhizopus stolonifer]|uniref:Uncharacterized protein n=1 Tax=Rhizopus stolonifer TaxID=4846 RepID=A0A367KVF4_RHIST|nr:hypothetical protein CU098_011498 [Rhizopus stolonifer]
MYPGGRELRNYIKESSDPNLNEFIKNNFHLINQDDATLKSMMLVWKNRFVLALNKYRSELVLGNRANLDINLWKSLKLKDGVDNASILYQWLYIAQEKKSEDANSFLQEKKEQIEQMETSTSQEVNALLDKLSIRLLRRFDNLSTKEMCVLKLSLSKIVDLVDDEMADVYKSVIPNRHFEEWMSLKRSKRLEEEEQSKIKTTVAEFVEKSKIDIKTARKYVLQKRLELEDEEDSLEARLFEMIDKIVSLIKNSKSNYWQEADFVAFIKTLLEIAFRGSSLSVVIGETVAHATKPAIEYNESSYSNGMNSVFNSDSPSFALTSKSSCVGRKIDLRIVSDDDQELSFWEFKNNDVDQKLLWYQESKSLRLAQCLQKEVSSVLKHPQDILSLNWFGWSATMCYLTQQDGYAVAKKIDKITVPFDNRLISTSLENLMLCIFEVKATLSALNDEMFIASNGRTKKRKSYDSMPHTLLSPKRQ